MENTPLQPSLGRKKDVIFNFEEFKGKVDSSKPIHHHATHRALNPHGLVYEITLNLEGISREGGWILRFETSRRIDTLSKEFHDKYSQKGNVYSALPTAFRELYNQLDEQYAKPMGATEGRWDT